MRTSMRKLALGLMVTSVSLALVGSAQASSGKSGGGSHASGGNHVTSTMTGSGTAKVNPGGTTSRNSFLPDLSGAAKSASGNVGAQKPILNSSQVGASKLGSSIATTNKPVFTPNTGDKLGSKIGGMGQAQSGGTSGKNGSSSGKYDNCWKPGSNYCGKFDYCWSKNWCGNFCFSNYCGYNYGCYPWWWTNYGYSCYSPCYSYAPCCYTYTPCYTTCYTTCLTPVYEVQTFVVERPAVVTTETLRLSSAVIQDGATVQAVKTVKQPIAVNPSAGAPIRPMDGVDPVGLTSSTIGR